MINTNSYYKNQLQKVIIGGGLLRFTFLFFVVVVFKNQVSTYIMSDDIVYEDVANNFLLYANSIFDIKAAAFVGVDGYLEVFWPYLMCFSAKLFNTAMAGRIINCALSTFCIYLVYNLTELISDRPDTALKAAKLFAFIPYAWIICCFPLKDIFLTTVVLIVFTVFVKFQKQIKIQVTHIIITLILLVAVSYTRDGVVEFLGIAGSIFFISSLIKNRKIHYAILVIIIGGIALSYTWDGIINAFKTKIDVYNSDDYISTGLMRYVQINKLSDIWKLPATYFFAMIQPMALSILSPNWDNWNYFLRVLNLSLYPIAFGNLAYAISTKKYNNLFWYASFVMYACVFSLSLGIYRHYLFLFPYLIINYSCYDSLSKQFTKNIVMIASISMIFFIVVLSLK